MELYQKGLTIAEISKQRELTTGTVAAHLAFLIEKKVLLADEVDKLVNKKTQKKIIKAAAKVGTEKLKPIYDELNEEVGYNEIRLVIAIC